MRRFELSYARDGHMCTLVAYATDALEAEKAIRREKHIPATTAVWVRRTGYDGEEYAGGFRGDGPSF